MLLHRRAAPGAVVLGYHDVVDTREAEGWSVTSDQLAAHLRTLLRLGLEVVDLGLIVDRIWAGESVDDLAAVTFDDALVGVHRHGLDVLAGLGLSATVFVVSDSRGIEPHWWQGSARTMTDAELSDVVDRGHRLGAHTRSHRSLPSLLESELDEEMSGSSRDVSELAGTPVDLLAYPSGHHDAIVRDKAGAAGFRAAFTFLNGRIRGSEDPLRLPRLTMGAHVSSWRLAYHLLRPASSWPDHQLDQVDAGSLR